MNTIYKITTVCGNVYEGTIIVGNDAAVTITSGNSTRRIPSYRITKIETGTPILSAEDIESLAVELNAVV